MPAPPRPQLAHVGIFVHDLDVMEKFYTRVFGLIVTDRGVGRTFQNKLVFLSGAADQHHQLVLSGGRGPDTPSTVMQLSFKVDCFDELAGLRDRGLECGATELIGLNHGNSWSVYYNDPEGNRIEVYMDTPFHTPQPCGDPLDLELGEEALLEQTSSLVARLPGGMPRSEYIREMEERLL